MEIIVILFIILVIAKVCGGGSKSNCCPGCGRDTLEQASHWWSGPYTRCSRTIMCGWNSRNAAKEQEARTKPGRPHRQPHCGSCGRENVSRDGQICSACQHERQIAAHLQDNWNRNGNINDNSR